jgi:PKD repeat protein
MKSHGKLASLCLLAIATSSYGAYAVEKQHVIHSKLKNQILSGQQFQSSSSDHAEHNCGTDHNGQDWQKLQKEFSKQVKTINKNKKTNRLKKNEFSLSFSLNQATSNELIEESIAVDGRYYIPLVVHVYGDAYNCSDDAEKCLTDEKIQDALRKLNEDFQGLSVDEEAISPQFSAIRENLNIEFVLAQKDPDGNPSNGIVRYSREEAGYGNAEANSKIAADSWDNFKYMNLYVMHDLHDDDVGNNSGIAWYPELAMSNAGTARVVYNGHYVGDNTNENFRSVLTHEFGHWLNLIHVFEDKVCTITNEAFCETTGDRSCDTPQMSMPKQMQNNAKNCLGQPTNTENFMHYTDNYAMFTQVQVDRMTAALHGPTRSVLWSNDNLIATGLNQYVSNSERAWDGTGLNTEPEGIVLESITDISDAQGGVETFEINLPDDANNILFYLDGYTQDPDLYLSHGVAPTPPLDENGEIDNNGDWIKDAFSFKGSGDAESISVDIPNTDAPYFVSVHAFSEYTNARLQVIQGEDPFLTEGMKRYTLFEQKDLWATKGEKVYDFQFTVPDNAERVVVVVPGKYQGPRQASGKAVFSGDLDMYVTHNAPIALGGEEEDYACRPYSWKAIAEYCEFTQGGTYNVLLDPFQSYYKADIHVYYETSNTGNQAPFAHTNGVNHYEAVNHAIAFSSKYSNDPDGEIVSYLWDFGDGNTSADANPIHAYTQIGEYDVALTVTDNFGATGVSNAKAIITLNSPNDAELCEGCTRFYLLTDEHNLSSIAGGTPKTYQFEVPDAASFVSYELVSHYNGDPDIHVSQNKEVSLETFDCRPWASPGRTELCTFDKGGIYNVMIDPFKDYDSLSFRAYYDIRDDADHSAPNRFPVANAGENNMGRANLPVTLNGQLSTDEDGSIVEYSWNFGNGLIKTGTTVEHAFTYSGTYNVTLTVTDDDGAAHFQTVPVVIIPVGDMDGDGDVDSDDIRLLSLAINENQSLDGSFDINNDGVIDSADARALRDLCSYERCSTVAPPPQAPVANALSLNNNVQVNTDVMFNGESSTDQHGQIVTYAWDFGDGNSSNWTNPIHQYEQPGIYDVVLTVTDNDGMMATSTIQQNVNHPLLQDACVDTPADDSRDLVPSVAKCVGSKKIFSFNKLDKHTTVAITLINAPEGSKIYFRDGAWPRVSTNEYSVLSTAQGDQQCALYNIPADSSNWGYIELSEVSEGATIVMDYDVASCRPLSEQLPLGNILQNDVVRLVSGVARGESIYTFEVPVGATNLSINTSGGTGDVDMHVKFGSEATKSDYDCRPWKVGSKETCNISNVQAGTYYIMLLGYNDFTDVNLVGTYTP